ncbi:hypothetical protein V1524DRAFT_121512 [Lipomyces starkeyi]
MVKMIPDSIVHFRKRVVKVEEVENKMLIHFQDGTADTADVIVGADGVKSHVRTYIAPEVAPAFSQKYAYRGLIPMEKAVDALGDELARNSQMYLGPHGHVLTFPISHGKTMNVVAFRSKDKWEDWNWVVNATREDMISDFDGWGKPVCEIVKMMEKPDIWALYDLPPVPSYYRSRVCIIGDAAHATTPHQGAGAGQALEDAFVLSRLLGDARVTTADDVVKAFKAFDAVRRERSQKVVTTSRECGMLYDFEVPGVEGNTDLIKKNLVKRWEWVWFEDLDAEVAHAQALL